EGSPGVRLCVATAGFSVARNLGGEPQPQPRPVQRRDAGLRNGIRRVADARIAARDDRPWPALRCPDLSVDPREEPGGGRVLGHHPRRRRGARAPRLAIAPDVPAPPAMYGTWFPAAPRNSRNSEGHETRFGFE